MNNKDSPFTFIAPELFQEPWKKPNISCLLCQNITSVNY